MLIAVALGAPERAQAEEPWLLDLEASGGAPVSAPQRDWYGPGGSLALGIGRPLAPWLLLEGRLRTALFLDGAAPSTPGVRDPSHGTLNSLTVGMLLRLPDGTERRNVGLWASAAMGGALTGKELRPTWEAGLGYGFALSDSMALGPLLRFVQVIQPDSQLAPDDARILLGGIRLSLLDRHAPRGAPMPSDRDGDGIEDARDRCPDAPEDKDGFEDEDGCPDEDNDQDGILDTRDGCPNTAEDKDGFQDEDGCADEDNDQDGVLDVDDACPFEPETLNGERDDDGCPDEGLIVMRDDRVVLEEQVLFDMNSARVKRSAAPELRALVKLQAQHPEWTKMRVEGHADARGDEAFNQELSERRATNVRQALISFGMDPELLVADGYGAKRLLTSDTTPEAHAKNRRVEFVVIARVPQASAPLMSPASVRAPGAEGEAASEQPAAVDREAPNAPVEGGQSKEQRP